MKRIVITGLMALLSLPMLASASPWDRALEQYTGDKSITVYRSPTCGCCSAWIEHLERHDFQVTDIKTQEMRTIKQRHGVPARLASCHTAIIDGYVIEGHVPADDIKRLLRQRPQVAGLSVPQMPVGSPGMEQGSRKDPFAVVQFERNGVFEAFNEYWAY